MVEWIYVTGETGEYHNYKGATTNRTIAFVTQIRYNALLHLKPADPTQNIALMAKISCVAPH
jgi:hypothetical protein